MEINKQLLTAEQVAELETWTELFHGAGWGALVKRYEPTIIALQNSYEKVSDVNTLGRLQGTLGVYKQLFLHLPDLIHYEFLLMTGQVDKADEGQDPDDPVSHPDWSR